MKIILAILAVFTSFVFFAGCKKDKIITSGNAILYTSVDILKFDTVFTSVGSVTKSFKIINANDKILRLSKVKLMGGSESSFKININGMPTSSVSDYEIAANDSIYVFVSITINPSDASKPFVISDSIQIEYNGNLQFVQLQAYGQNAIFLENVLIDSDASFNNQKPYVILGSLNIAQGASLRIPAGTKIYCHANAAILVDGSLIVEGQKNNEVVFQGDRLDEPYNSFPSSWPGIYFLKHSMNNSIVFGIIKNAHQAIVLQETIHETLPVLKIQQSIIENAYEAGVFSTNSNLDMNNCLIANCGTNLLIRGGGKYDFTNCTIASYSNKFITHKNPVTTINNNVTVGGNIENIYLDAKFTNSIFWGDDGVVENEIFSDRNSNSFSVELINCIYKGKEHPASIGFTSTIDNIPPLFDSINVSRNFYNFGISNPNAPGINNGVSTIFTKDLHDNNRSNDGTDIGCYELN